MSSEEKNVYMAYIPIRTDLNESIKVGGFFEADSAFSNQVHKLQDGEEYTVEVIRDKEGLTEKCDMFIGKKLYVRFSADTNMFGTVKRDTLDNPTDTILWFYANQLRIAYDPTPCMWCSNFDDGECKSYASITEEESNWDCFVVEKPPVGIAQQQPDDNKYETIFVDKPAQTDFDINHIRISGVDENGHQIQVNIHSRDGKLNITVKQHKEPKCEHENTSVRYIAYTTKVGDDIAVAKANRCLDCPAILKDGIPLDTKGIIFYGDEGGSEIALKNLLKSLSRMTERGIAILYNKLKFG